MYNKPMHSASQDVDSRRGGQETICCFCILWLLQTCSYKRTVP